MSTKVIIIGGGAAGFFCAVNAAKQNPYLKITILEKHAKKIKKVKVSGGGRCNVTHHCKHISELVKCYPRGKNFLKKAFSLFSANDTIKWFEERGVQLKTESDGRVFPSSNQSQTIIDCLLEEASRYNVHLQLQTEVISIDKVGQQYHIHCKNKSTLFADKVFIGCGGFPKLEQYTMFESLGLQIITPVPSLFTCNTPNSGLKKLMGLVVENASLQVASESLAERGSVLCTHWGLSGPAVLKLSSFGARLFHEKGYKATLHINFISKPESALRNEWAAIRTKQSTNTMGNKNPFELPNRLWDYILEINGIAKELKWSELPSKEQNKLMHTLTSHEVEMHGKTTFKEEFVTCGGISVNEVNPLTMEAYRHPGLFFGGEILDIDGITGGYNFQHAWTSAYIAAKQIARAEM